MLEAGAVVVTYDHLSDEEVDLLTAEVTDDYDGRVAVTPYPELDGARVAFAAWGVMQRCDAVDLDALQRFVSTYASDDPAVPGSDTTPRTAGPDQREG